MISDSIYSFKFSSLTFYFNSIVLLSDEIYYLPAHSFLVSVYYESFDDQRFNC